MKLTLSYGLLLLALLFPVVTVCLGVHIASWLSLYALACGSIGLMVYGAILLWMKTRFPGRRWMAIVSLLAGLGWLVVQLYIASGWSES
ncbi:hypothetical protein BWI93_07695 [Siphonobacter sp. BAB-5385]|uniref:hypothetical protein n=1 Tax=unclassified Siphonobacter TaxID=2635712 RepID=UPI000B9E66E7|nr:MULTISPECIES: hypothetical protein [unclassified Siphonobacter]OZI08728.1 hypothetical protein BWI93_07695 [Siphonobacter sp. BAB-5385]PMD99194.1 hypothetical protein BWI97_01950 [Siphonobacter sp. BAB-5405]